MKINELFLVNETSCNNILTHAYFTTYKLAEAWLLKSLEASGFEIEDKINEDDLTIFVTTDDTRFEIEAEWLNPDEPDSNL